MIFANSARRLAFLAALAFAVPAAAQDVSDTHLKAARAAIAAIKATDQFDLILPQAGQALKQELIQKNPDLQQLISQTVDEHTLKMVARRSDLEKEAALAYARVFTEAELNEIATFYSAPVGQKLLSDGPIVTRKVLEAADIWQRGVARDLAVAVGEQLNTITGVNQPAPAPAPDGGAQPAPAGGEGGTTPPAN
jgi:hypothetical protein